MPETNQPAAELLPEPLRQLLATWVAMELDYRKATDRLREHGERERAENNESKADMLSFCSRELLAVAKWMETRTQPPAVPLGVIELLDAALLHPESAESYIRQVIEMLSTNAVPLDAPCKWTLVEEVKGEHPNLYRSDCGIMLTRRQEWWKYCQLCGKEIQ